MWYQSKDTTVSNSTTVTSRLWMCGLGCLTGTPIPRLRREVKSTGFRLPWTNHWPNGQMGLYQLWWPVIGGAQRWNVLFWHGIFLQKKTITLVTNNHFQTSTFGTVITNAHLRYIQLPLQLVFIRSKCRCYWDNAPTSPKRGSEDTTSAKQQLPWRIQV